MPIFGVVYWLCVCAHSHVQTTTSYTRHTDAVFSIDASVDFLVKHVWYLSIEALIQCHFNVGPLAITLAHCLMVEAEEYMTSLLVTKSNVCPPLSSLTFITWHCTMLPLMRAILPFK